MYLIDTNVVSELRKAKSARMNQGVLAWSKSVPAPSLFLSVITILELEKGVLGVARRDPAQAAVLAGRAGQAQTRRTFSANFTDLPYGASWSKCLRDCVDAWSGICEFRIEVVRINGPRSTPSRIPDHREDCRGAAAAYAMDNLRKPSTWGRSDNATTFLSDWQEYMYGYFDSQWHHVSALEISSQEESPNRILSVQAPV